MYSFIIFYSFIHSYLKSDDNEAYEDVDHEEGNDDDIDDIEDGHNRFVVIDRTVVFLVCVDGQPQKIWPSLVSRQFQGT